MFKILCLALVILVLNGEASSSVLPNDNSILLTNNKAKGQFSSHIKDFLVLIDIEKFMGVVITYINDPEVLKFMGFILSPQMKELLLEFESMPEFREALAYLALKGYDVHYLINIVNSLLNLPPIEISQVLVKSRKGVTGLITDMIASLPLEDMKKLFESKLETSPEVAQLFATINSEEFLQILRRMSHNPKFMEFKVIFEGYGFDFKYICQLAIGILGDYYQGVFCI